MINFKENPTNADELLYLLYMGGYKIQVKDNRLTVTPAHALDDEMINLIVRFKDDLIRLFQK